MDRLLEKSQETLDREHKNADHRRNWGNLLILVTTWIVPLVICTSIITSNQREFIRKLDNYIATKANVDTTWKVDVDTVYMNKAKNADSIIVTATYFKQKPEPRPK